MAKAKPKKKVKRKGPPKFVKTLPADERVVVDESFRDLGIELSKQLPTYDVPIDLIEPSGWNSNEMDDKTLNRLVQEMEETGMIDPIQIIPSKGNKFRILGGEHRWLGARTLGWKKIPCNILTDKKFLDEKLHMLLTVRMNVIKGKQNREKFLKLKEEVAKKYGDEQLQALFGFTSTDAWKRLTEGIVKSVAESGVGGKRMAKELRKKSKKVRTVDGLGAVINRLFKKYGNDLAYSFMVFAFGGKEHLFILSNDRMTKALEKVKDLCRKKNLDINDVIAPVIEELSEKIAPKKKKKKK